MYSNGEKVGIVDREGRAETICRHDDQGHLYSLGKRITPCRCPKCSIYHHVYMRWTGQGMPRKYCASCRHEISGYDDAATYETAVTSGNWEKKEAVAAKTSEAGLSITGHVRHLNACPKNQPRTQRW